MSTSVLLGSALNTSTNPDPNSLGTKRPYTASNARNWTPPLSRAVDAGWVTQSAKALFPMGRDSSQTVKIKVHFVPSNGAAVTYTIKYWTYNPTSNTWSQPYTGGSVSYTGEQIDYIDNPGNDAIFLQISTISAGTLSIYYDPSGAEGA